MSDIPGGRIMLIPNSPKRAWMAEWLAAFLEERADDLAERDAVVLDQIREAIGEGP